MRSNVERKTSMPGCCIRLHPIEPRSSFPSRNVSILTSCDCGSEERATTRRSRLLWSIGGCDLWKPKKGEESMAIVTVGIDLAKSRVIGVPDALTGAVAIEKALCA